MTATRFSFEEFDPGVPDAAPVSPEAAPSPGDAERERVRMAAYEAGYKSGWDDATRAAEEDAARIRADLSRSFADLTFSYFEARDDVLHKVSDVLTELLDALFPACLPEAAAAAAINAIGEGIGAATDGPLRLLVCPDDGEAIGTLLAQLEPGVAEVASDPALLSGQVRLRGPGVEAAIDVDRVVERLRAAISATGASDRSGMAERESEAVAEVGEPERALG